MVIGAVVCAGLLGVFGNGWMSTSTRHFSGMPLAVTYQRLMRANAPADLTVAITGRLPGNVLELGVGSELLDRASIGSTQPGAAAISATTKGGDLHLPPRPRPCRTHHAEALGPPARAGRDDTPGQR